MAAPVEQTKIVGETGELKALEHLPNRKERRAKSRKFTIADMRGLKARIVMNDLFAKKEDHE